LAESLKKLLETKPLSKITISDITNGCNVNRNTFYYHFRDIYDLVEWIFKDSGEHILDGKKTFETWREGFLNVLNYVLDNKEFVQNTFRSIGKGHLFNFLYKNTYTILYDIINEKSKSIEISEDYKEFIASFYRYAFVGIIADWIESGMKKEPEELADEIELLIKDDFWTH